MTARRSISCRSCLAWALLVASLIGCASSLPYNVDEAFRKKVAKDPFPSAAQQGIYSSTVK